MNNEVTWISFKNLIDSKNLEVRYTESSTEYEIWANELTDTYSTVLDIESPASIDQVDFEQNYKNNANKKIDKLVAETVPQGTNKVEEIYLNNVDGTTDDLYVIPQGKILTIQRLSGGSSLSLGTIVSTRAELFYDPNGDGSVLNYINTIYLSLDHVDRFLNKEFAGDGIAVIRTRRTALDIGAREVFVKWEGYLK